MPSSWRPPTDDQLTWFRPPNGPVPAHPRTVDLNLTVPAFTFGVSRALESLYFPLYELRSKVFDGWLYLAVSPSEFAEHDLAAQKRRRCDSALRFSRDIEAAWQRIRPEIEEYTRFFETFEGPAGADELARLRRVRANQWFVSTRAVFAPAVLLQQEGIGQTPKDVAVQVVAEARTAVLDVGLATFNAALERLAPHLSASEYDEPIVGSSAPAHSIGRELPGDAARMYMIEPLLRVLAG